MKKCPDIFIVDAYPLENERIDVCVYDLQTNHAELSQLLKTVDPRLVVNIDECGWGKWLSHRKKRVVSFSPMPTTYHEYLDEGHVTVIPVS